MTQPRSGPGPAGYPRNSGEPGRSAGPRTRLPRDQVQRIFARDGYLAVNELGEQLGRVLARDATPSQIRNILNSFQTIAETWEATHEDERERQIAKLKPNLVYLEARETHRDKRELLQGLTDTLGYGIDAVLTGSPDQVKQRYTALVALVEAITAYHRLQAPRG